MTELVEKNVPYEIIIRLNQHGVRGAQYQTLHVVTFGDRLIKEQENLPVPFDLAGSASDRKLFEKVLGEALVQALVEREQAMNRIAELESRLHGHDNAAFRHEARRGLSDEEMRERSIKALRPGQGH